MERNTRQRTAIREAIAHAGRPLLPQEILELSRNLLPRLSLATVYRNLHLLLDEGAIRPVVLPGDSARYELASSTHHHHFQCRNCLKVLEIHGCLGGSKFAALAPTGCIVEDHELTLYGKCSSCAAGQPTQQP